MAGNLRPSIRVHQSHWLWVLCLVGLDYFSSLAYQPSIAFEAAGSAAPLATVGVVMITLLGALPVYAYVAGRSPAGQGATGLLERSVHGWLGKLFVLILLGFAATDFVITKTLSVADAAQHLIYNPHPKWQQALEYLGTADERAKHLLPYALWERALEYWNRQLAITVLLSILGFVFWAIFRRGFTKQVVRLAVVAIAAYLLLNAIIIGSGCYYLALHPELVHDWWMKLDSNQGQLLPAFSAIPAWISIAALCLLSFPQMSLGLSGFELSMVVMPLIRAKPGGGVNDTRRRVRNARKLLMIAALIMSLYLLASSLVTTLLIRPDALTTAGQAANRALAYMAHGGQLIEGVAAQEVSPLFGELFGTIYDLNTIVILGLAGTSVTLGLRRLVPEYLHHLGMDMGWANYVGAILYVFNCINLIVIVYFRASVTAQRGAYATSVLVLMGSAAAAATIDLWQRRTGPAIRRLSWFYVVVASLFWTSAVAAIIAQPDGLLIALSFVVALFAWSVVSRLVRSTELRFEGFQFKDAQSQFLWESLIYLEFPVLVPHRPGQTSLLSKEEKIRQRHRLPPDVPVVFLEVELGDVSDFYHRPMIEAVQEEGRFILYVTSGASIPHVIAAVALELSKVGKPPEIHFGWSDESPLTANLNFLLFGQGNVPWMVRELIRKAEPDPERRPPIIIG